MLIKRQVYSSILLCSMHKEYEIGGIIGGRTEIIDTFKADNSNCQTSRTCYIPNILEINYTILDWQKRNINFYGIFHSHLDRSEHLSSDDKRYIRKIMTAMPSEIKKLYFPLVLPKCEKIIAFKAIRNNPKFDIVKDDVEIY